MKLFSKFRAFLRKANFDADMAEEMQAHLERRTQSNLAAGMSPEEARYAAHRQFGGLEQIKEIAREERGWIGLETTLRDLSFALRQFRKSPGFTFVAVLIVAIGIGSATAMFSVVNALVLRPFPLPEADRLAVIYDTNFARNVPFYATSVPNYLEWKARSRSWTALAAIRGGPMNLTGGSSSELVDVRAMTANFLPTLGLAPAIGRGFLSEEDQPGHNRVAIITAEFAQRRFGRVSAELLGKSLILDGINYVIVGVMAAGAPFPQELEIAIPLGANAATEGTTHSLEVYGRLKPGVTLERADAEMKAIAAQISAEFPAADRGWSTVLVPLSHELVGPEVRTGLFVLLGAVGLLLLIACANFSNLLLIRASARAHEIAIRTALGASRWRVIRQLVTESLAVTGAGGALGVLLSLWAVGMLRSVELPRASEISVDFRVLAVACGITLLVGVFAAIGPALRTSQTRPQEALKGRAPRSGHRSRLRDGMVVAQLALSLALVIGATTLIRSFWRLLQVNPGFTTERVLTLSVKPADNTQAVSFFERITERVAALPGVQGAGIINSLPLTNGNTGSNIFPVGPSVLPAGESLQSSWRLVDGGYFETMQIPLLRGRTFAGMSPNEARSSVVLSASLARRLFGDQDPVGRQIASARADGNRLTVIGVVGDVRSSRLDLAAPPTFYWSMHRFLYGQMSIVVRTTGEAKALAAAIRGIIKEVDPSVPVFRVRMMGELRKDSLSRERLTTALLGGFAVTALVLAALGTYGVVAFTVQERTREIGIRIAIGAQAGDILHLVLGQGFRLVALGVVLGLGAALASGRMLAALLYETGATDPLSCLFATAILACAALGACFLPTFRATKTDPMIALRCE
ncbi:MAG TPA: ABC transporter permease [Bryobacteraceae bacterium]|nr:ABC transporter permease [Bryobacteraceae bacterium]